MEKLNYNKLTYLVYLLFSITVCFFFFNYENKNLETKNEFHKKIKVEEKKQIKNNPEPVLLSFKDIIEIKKQKNIHATKSQSSKINLNNKTKIQKPEERIFFSSKIKIKDTKQKEKYKYLSKPLKDKKVKKNKNHSFSFLSDPIEKSIVKKHKLTDDNKVKYKSNIQDTVQHSILIGSKFLENNNFMFSFKWPQDTYFHDKIYSLLRDCLGVRGIIIDNNRNFFSMKGKLNYSQTKLYSRIFRSPSAIYSTKEKQNINLIRKNNNLGKHGTYYRIFKKQVDAFIIGKFLLFAKKNNQKLENFSGEYILIDNMLYIDNLEINEQKIQNKINLSEIYQSCNQN